MSLFGNKTQSNGSNSNGKKPTPSDKNRVMGHAIFSGILQLLFWISYFNANWQSESKCQTFHFSFLGIIIIDLVMTLHRFYRAHQLVTQDKVIKDVTNHPLIWLVAIVLGITLLIIRKKISSECKHEAYMAYIMSGLLVAYWILVILQYFIVIVLGIYFAGEQAKEERERKQQEEKAKQEQQAARQAALITPKKGFKWPWSRGDEEV